MEENGKEKQPKKIALQRARQKKTMVCFDHDNKTD